MRFNPQILFSRSKVHLYYPTPLTRPMTTTSAPSSSTPPSAISFSADSDIPTLTTSLHALLHPVGRWRLTPQRNGLERTFKFKGFKKTWDFMTAIATECKSQNHHPEWSNVYNTTFVRWTTHVPPGLSVKDVEMARFCDAQGEAFGEVVPVKEAEGDGEGQEGKGVARELVERAVVEGGDCCVPKRRAGEVAKV